MEGRAGLLALFSHWDRQGAPLTCGALRHDLPRLALRAGDVAAHVVFNDVAYQRVLILRTAAYEVLLLGWRSGQRSPIHDHGESTCAVYVVEGVATETLFMPSGCGRLVPAHSRSGRAGTLWVARDGDVHQMANLEGPAAGRDLISLHVYSPPLTTTQTYSLDATTLAGHDGLAALRPRTLRADEAHASSRLHLTGMKQVTP